MLCLCVVLDACTTGSQDEFVYCVCVLCWMHVPQDHRMYLCVVVCVGTTG